MPTKVEIPSLGESVTEAILVKWIKQNGDTVAVDDPICELETDKANVELPAPAAGVLQQLKKQGDTVRIGDAVAQIDSAGAGRAAPAAAKPEPKRAAAAPEVPAAKASAPPSDRPATSSRESAPQNPHGAPIDAFTPSVRKAARDTGVDPSTLQGSGPKGRIVKEDVLAAKTPAPSAAPAPTAPQAKATSLVPPGAPSPGFDAHGVKRVPMTKIRKRIAERLVAAQHQAAMLTTFNEIDMTEVMELREKYKQKFQDAYAVSLGFMSFFARACAQALKEFPTLNASLEGDEILFHEQVHLGVAVSTERGLVVPVLKNAGALSFAKIELEIKRMALAAREGKLGLQELGGGTFTITNGGVFGSLMSTPILNAPQSGILGLHAIQKRPVGVGDRIELRPMMYVALSYDHRLVDGRESVSFLVRVKQMLEDPARLMLEI